MGRYDLSAHNTLKISATADRVVQITRREQLQPFLLHERIKKVEEESEVGGLYGAYRVLGEGSNIVFADDHIDLTVLLMRLKGIVKIAQEGDFVIWRVAAGESWHGLVQTSLCAGLSGLENLSLIPGMVGAAPIQNIGAYGVELSDVLVRVEAIDMRTGVVEFLEAEQCQLGYRDSLFKQAEGRHYVILSVDLRLNCNRRERYSPILGYGQLEQRVEQLLESGMPLTPKMVSRAVIEIRREKLPDPHYLPNAGSFFKNPVISESDYQRIKRDFVDVVVYPLQSEQDGRADGKIDVETDGEGAKRYKLAAGWLIDAAGLKGYQQGRVAVHKQQALVLVNCSGRSGSEREPVSGREVLALADHIRTVIMETFGVRLEIEPTVVRN